jgi:hypothetical protein
MDPNELFVRTVYVLLPVGLWCAYWLWAVNWKVAWKVLGQGGWAPLVLLVVVAAAAWSRIKPEGYNFANLATIPNIWWQFAAVLLAVGLALFCGWLQGVLRYTPITVEVAPRGARSRP